MRIHLPLTGPTRGPERPRAPAAGRDSASFARAVEGSRVAGGGSAPPTAPTLASSALLAVQEVPDASERRRRALRHADMLLDELEALRDGLIEGILDRGRLLDLAARLRAQADDIDDPRLAGLVRDVEVRAAVELAKLERDLALDLDPARSAPADDVSRPVDTIVQLLAGSSRDDD